MGKTVLKHLAIIMDCNGRWAEQRGFKRTKGHEQGAETIREITMCFAKHPTVETTTFYAFSTENWKRPKLEVQFLMKMLDKYLKEEIKTNQDNNKRIKDIGDISEFSRYLKKLKKKT